MSCGSKLTTTGSDFQSNGQTLGMVLTGGWPTQAYCWLERGGSEKLSISEAIFFPEYEALACQAPIAKHPS